jgi:hypothetical protein
MDRCINACRQCQITMEKDHPCVACCYDCEQICNFSKFANLNISFLDISLLDLCNNACTFCILECTKHMEHHDTCKECVAACLECISECQEKKLVSLRDTFK